MNKNSRLVYSTDQGRHCPECGEALHTGPCQNRSQDAPVGDGIVRLRRETKGRKGKGVTLIDGLPLTGGEINKLAKELKQFCGTGGSVKQGVIEIQGDQRDRLKPELEARGFKVKLAGG